MSLQSVQKEIVQVLDRYFNEQYFEEESFDGSEPKVKKLNVFEQRVPDKSLDEDVEEDWEYPFITVSLVSGRSSTDKRTKISFGIGIKDQALDNSGHLILESIIEKMGLLLKEETLFTYSTPEKEHEWAMNDEDYYPYYFGVVETHWNHM